jgi:hypothetical protein
MAIAPWNCWRITPSASEAFGRRTPNRHSPRALAARLATGSDHMIDVTIENFEAEVVAALPGK